jgi:hypothetical protein
MDAMGASSAASWKNIGRIKSDGLSEVSRTKERMAGVRRLRRGRFMGEDWTMAAELQSWMCATIHNGDGIRRRIIAGVSQADLDFRDAMTLCKLRRCPEQNQLGRTRRIARDLKIQPTGLPTDARAKCLGDRLLRRKSRRVMKCRLFLTVTVGTLARGEKLAQKRISMALDGAGDPPDFHHIDSYPENAHDQAE